MKFFSELSELLIKHKASIFIENSFEEGFSQTITILVGEEAFDFGESVNPYFLRKEISQHEKSTVTH